eukprot:947980_1
MAQHTAEEFTVFKWNVTGDELKQFKNAKYKKTFFSPKFNTIGGVWSLAICPNGLLEEGTAYMFIQCHSHDRMKKKLKVCHYVDISQVNHSEITFDGTTFEGGIVPCKSPFQMKNIRSKSALSIEVTLWREESIDQEWREYFITETNRMTPLLSRSKLSVYHFTTQQFRKDNLKLKAILNGIASYCSLRMSQKDEEINKLQSSVTDQKVRNDALSDQVNVLSHERDGLKAEKENLKHHAEVMTTEFETEKQSYESRVQQHKQEIE